MKAFLLSAGLGTRRRPLTDHIPKCLLPIGGKPLLQIWLDLMGRHGVFEVMVNTHWFAEKVEDFVHGLTQRRKGAKKRAIGRVSSRLFFMSDSMRVLRETPGFGKISMDIQIKTRGCA